MTIFIYTAILRDFAHYIEIRKNNLQRLKALRRSIEKLEVREHDIVCEITKVIEEMTNMSP